MHLTCVSEFGVIRDSRIADALKLVDRGQFTKALGTSSYEDKPHQIGQHYLGLLFVCTLI